MRVAFKGKHYHTSEVKNFKEAKKIIQDTVANGGALLKLNERIAVFMPIQAIHEIELFTENDPDNAWDGWDEPWNEEEDVKEANVNPKPKRQRKAAPKLDKGPDTSSLPELNE